MTELGRAHQLALQYPDAVRTMRDAITALGRWPASEARTRLIVENRSRLAWIYERAALTERAEAERAAASAASTAANGPAVAEPGALRSLELPSPLNHSVGRLAPTLRKFASGWISERRISAEYFSMEAMMLASLQRLDRGASAANQRDAMLINTTVIAVVASTKTSAR